MSETLLEKVRAGREGKTPWVDPPFTKLRRHFGIGQAMYTIIGGASSTGKSALAHWSYVIGAYESWLNRDESRKDVKLKIFCYALERPKDNTLAKWIALKIMRDHGRLLDVKTILGFGTAERMLTEEEVRWVIEAKEYYDEMFENVVTLIDIKEGPTAIRNRIRRWAHENGKTYRKLRDGSVEEAYLDTIRVTVDGEVREEEREFWKKVENPTPEQIPEHEWEWHYVPDDPNLITVIVIDHVGLVPNEKVANSNVQKGNLDRISDYMQMFRDRYFFSPVLVTQFNRNEQDVSRRRFTNHEPEAQDIEGSSRLFHDADVVLGLFNPHKYGIEKFAGYQVGKLVNAGGYNRLRGLKILKNSYGPDDLVGGVWFVGETGYFEELPDSYLMDDALYHEFANVTRFLKGNGNPTTNGSSGSESAESPSADDLLSAEGGEDDYFGAAA